MRTLRERGGNLVILLWLLTVMVAAGLPGRTFRLSVLHDRMM
jgi:hypothetical protein